MLSTQHRPRLNETVDGAREGEVAFGEAAGVVRGRTQRDLVPVDRDRGVVIEFIGRLRDGVDERKRFVEIGELDGVHDCIPVAVPAGNGGELALDVGVAKRFWCHHGSNVPEMPGFTPSGRQRA